MSANVWSALTWDVARAGGFTAFILLTLSMALGLALSQRWQRPLWPRLITNEMHNFATTLSLVFLAVHGLAIWLDPYTHFAWNEVLLPFAAHYRPIWMAAGIVGAYLMLAVWISTQVRSRIPYVWWRKLHALAFAVYLLSLVHGLGAGSDTKHSWALALYGVSALLVGGLLINRLLTPIGAKGSAHPRLAALTGGIMATVTVWAAAGALP